MKAVIELTRSLGFGALLGGGLAGLIYNLLPEANFSVSHEEAMIIGGLIGAGLHRAVEVYISWVLRPVGDFLSYYAGVMEIRALRHFGMLSEKQAEEIFDELTIRRFLGRSYAGKPLNSPPEQVPQVKEVNSQSDKDKEIALINNAGLEAANPSPAPDSLRRR